MVQTQTNRSRHLRTVAGQGTAGRLSPSTVSVALDVTRIAASSRWDTLAACRDKDPELFYPVGTSGPAKEQEAEAKAVCARCPVRTRCLEEALAIGDVYGVRGGMTEGERKDLIRAGSAVSSSDSSSEEETEPRQSA